MAQKPDGPLRDALLVTLQSVPRVSEDVQHASWTRAVTTKDTELLTALTSRQDLVPDLVAAAKAKRDIPVRVAYLLRESTSKTEFMAMLADESRAGVFAGACGEAGSLADQPELAALLLTRMTGKPTRALAEAVLELPGGEPMLYARALVEMPSRQDLKSATLRAMGKVAVTVATDQAATEHALSNATLRTWMTGWNGQAADWVVTLIRANGTSAKTRLVVVEELLTPRIPAISGTGGSIYNRALGYEQVQSALLSADDVQREVLDRLDELAQTIPGPIGQDLRNTVTGYNPAARNEAHQARLDLLEAARTTKDAEQMLDIVTTYSSDRDVMAALSANENLVGGALAHIAVSIAGNNPSQALALARKHGGIDVATAVYANAAGGAVHADHWAIFPSPEEGKRLVIEELGKRSGRNHYSASVFDQLLDVLEDGDPALGLLPWELLAQKLGSWHRNSAGTRRLCAYLVEQQHAKLGTDLARWETMDTLARGFVGSIDELVDTAAVL